MDVQLLVLSLEGWTKTDWRLVSKRKTCRTSGPPPAGRWRKTAARRTVTGHCTAQRPSRSARPCAIPMGPPSGRRPWATDSTMALVATRWLRNACSAPPWLSGHYTARERDATHKYRWLTTRSYILVLGERRDLWSYGEPALLTPVHKLPVPSALVCWAQFLDVPLLYKGPIFIKSCGLIFHFWYTNNRRSSSLYSK